MSEIMLHHVKYDNHFLSKGLTKSLDWAKMAHLQLQGQELEYGIEHLIFLFTNKTALSYDLTTVVKKRYFKL